MYQIYTAKRLRKNDNLINVLENLLGTNKTPKRLIETDGVVALINNFENFNYKAKRLKSYNLKISLENWAKENQMVVIATSCALVVFCASFAFPKSPITMITNSLSGEVTMILNSGKVDSLLSSKLAAGFYYEDEVIIKESIPINEAEYNGEILVSTIPTDVPEENTDKEIMTAMIEEYMQEQIRILEQKRLEERVKEEKTYIQLYSDIFGLDYEKVYQILSDITNDFQDEAYLNDYIIGDSTLKKRTVVCTSKEMAILIAVRNLYWSPEKYGYPYNDLKTGIEYTCDLEYSKQIAYISNVLGVDSALNYAICKLECNFNSPLFINKHNPAGLRFTSGSYTAFPSITAGFIEEALELVKYQIDGRTTIESIGSKHAPTSDPANSTWVSSVTSLYNSATKNQETLFGGDITLIKEPILEMQEAITYYGSIEETVESETSHTETISTPSQLEVPQEEHNLMFNYILLSMA